jgi:NTE family protein
MIDTIKDNSSNNNNDRKLISAKNKNGETVGIPTRQRALILQGGGALGAYEIGVLQSIYKHLAKNNGIVKKSERAESMFDIVAGVSIGAINAVFLVDQILKNNSWDNSIALLERFWDNFIAYTLVDRNPLFDFAWNTTRFFNKDTASLESARRYWSFYELACTVWPFGRGFSPNLCTAIQKFDSKFLSPLNNCLLYDFRLLRDLLTKTAKIDYPIKTSFEMNQPRLLLISVDVKDCSTPVTFDSYRSYASKCDVCNKECNTNDFLVKHMRSDHIRTQISKESLSTLGSSSSTLYRENASKLRTILESIDDDDGDDDALWYSVYGDEENLKQKHVVCYNGIGEDQLMASCLFPYSNYHPTLYDLITNEIRTYWDGAFLSNTPLRELLQRHREFWENYFHENNIKYDDLGLTEEDDGGKKNNEDLRPRVPDLEVFIVNLYPALERLDELIPSDKDKIEDRLNDIRFHDRTKYDEKVADIVTDYIDLSRELITLAKQNGVSQKTIDDILAKKGESKKRNIQEKRQYRSLLEGRFRAKVYRIQRQDDGDTIFGKASDFSYTTVKDLIDRGRRETDDWFKSDYKLR